MSVNVNSLHCTTGTLSLRQIYSAEDINNIAGFPIRVKLMKKPSSLLITLIYDEIFIDIQLNVLLSLTKANNLLPSLLFPN